MDTWILGKTKLRKKTGHEFHGTFVSIFNTLEGEKRIVAQSTTYGSRGLLFIFRPDQMEVHDAAN